MALVQGEDSESDEEINTDQITLSPLHVPRFSPLRPEQQQKASVVEGEESETDEEDGPGTAATAPLDQPDGRRLHAGFLQPPRPSSHGGSSRDLETSSRGSVESSSTTPPAS